MNPFRQNLKSFSSGSMFLPLEGDSITNPTGSQESPQMLIKEAINEIAAGLVMQYERGEKLNVQKMTTIVCRKLSLSSQPRLTEIIACIPLKYKDAILPQIKAKPVRTASGIAIFAVMCKPHISGLSQSIHYRDLLLMTSSTLISLSYS
ncbi:hypothetical protein ACOME3_006488 [Neoechinorhynchus agilis]